MPDSELLITSTRPQTRSGLATSESSLSSPARNRVRTVSGYLALPQLLRQLELYYVIVTDSGRASGLRQAREGS